MRVDQEVIQQIKSRLDIVEIASRFVEVKQRGTRWVCLCPFHEETKPSFYLNRELGLYYCFGCQASGDVIDLYCKLKGLDFIEGIKELAEEVGISLSLKEAPKVQKISKKEYLKANLLAQKYFKAQLRSEKKALEYLKSRNISDDLVEKFGIGFAPDNFEGLKDFLLNHNIKEDIALEAGLLTKKGNRTFDRFRRRITFPIMDIGGDIVGFGGRIVGDGEPKYLNTNETPYFKKGQILYGLFQAKRAINAKKEVIITEGYVDLITLFQYGFENSCAVLGTALTEDHIKRLSLLCNKVFLVFDGDQAGRRASFRSAEMLLKEGFEVKVVLLPEGEDIDSFLKTKGKEDFEKMLNNAQEGIDFCIKMVENNSPGNLIGWCVSFLKKIEDFGLKSYYLPRISSLLKISEPLLRKAVEDSKLTNLTKAKKESGSNINLPLRDKEFLSFAINFPDYIIALDEEGIYDVFESELCKSLWKKLVSYGHKDILNYLDNIESSLYIKLAVSPVKGIDPEGIFKDIVLRIREIKKEKIKKELREKIKEAEKNKNFEEMKRLLKKYQTL